MLRDGNYVVASEPSDEVALYFAAHLLHQWMMKNADRRVFDVRWLAFGSEPDFKLGDDLLQGQSSCDLLVIANLSPNSTTYRLQKTRDLLTSAHRRYPAIVVVAGEDPVSFFATRVYARQNAIFFKTSKAIVRRVEII